jgi:RNA 2',3'-cyclic 3'-phosphodiesterase
MSRLFLALEPSPATRQALAEVSAAARQAAGDLASALRWVTPENLHVTLHFLGDLDARARDRVVAALETPLDAAIADVRLHELGTFPPAAPPRVLWVSLSPAAPVEAVYRDLSSRVSAAGLPVDPRPFLPHVTLARVRDRERRRTRELLARVRSVSVPAAHWHVDRATLFESDLSGAVPRYAAVRRVMLAAP